MSVELRAFNRLGDLDARGVLASACSAPRWAAGTTAGRPNRDALLAVARHPGAVS